MNTYCLNLDNIDTGSIEKYRQEFEANEKVVIEKFLSDNHAEKFYNFLNKDMPDNWWYSSFFPYDDDKPRYIRNIDDNEKELQQGWEIANNAYDANKFSYAFHRTLDNHYPHCACELCKFMSFIKGPEMLDFVKNVTNMDITKHGELFASKYDEGCFLATHTDRGNGSIAMVFNLTKDWEESYGGCLNLLKPGSTKVIVPGFNKLVLFKIRENSGTPHFVSHVNKGVKEKRLSVTGWFR